MTKRAQSLPSHMLTTAAIAGLLSLGVQGALGEKKSTTAAENNKLVYVALAKAPEKARAKRNPFESDPDAVAAGRKLFEQHCAECHGQTAEGAKRGPSLRPAEVQQAPAGAIFWILTNGVVRRGMPDWSNLPEPERWQLVTFLKSLGPAPKLAEGHEVNPQKHPTGGTSSEKGGLSR